MYLHTVNNTGLHPQELNFSYVPFVACLLGVNEPLKEDTWRWAFVEDILFSEVPNVLAQNIVNCVGK